MTPVPPVPERATPFWGPNPGSPAAIAAGCKCAVIDNNHGQFPVIPPDGWWITAGCPVHYPEQAS